MWKCMQYILEFLSKRFWGYFKKNVYCRSGASEASEGTTLYNRTIRTSARMVGFEGNCTCSKIQGKCSSDLIFQDIDEIFWVFTLFTFLQLFILIIFFVQGVLSQSVQDESVLTERRAWKKLFCHWFVIYTNARLCICIHFTENFAFMPSMWSKCDLSDFLLFYYISFFLVNLEH